MPAPFGEFFVLGAFDGLISAFKRADKAAEFNVSRRLAKSISAIETSGGSDYFSTSQSVESLFQILGGYFFLI